MSYEAWRISFQSSEAAAKSAFLENNELRLKILKLEKALKESESRESAAKIVSRHTARWLEKLEGELEATRKQLEA